MPRTAGVRWEERSRAWRSDVGPRLPSGRRGPVYFRRDDAGPLARADRPRALALLAAYLIARERAETPTPHAIAVPWTVEQVVEAYLQERQAHAAPRTYATHRERLTAFLAHRGPDGVRLGARAARTLAAADLEHFARTRAAAGHKPNYVAGLVRSAKACWAWAARPVPGRDPERLLPADPLAAVKAPAVGQPPERYCPPEAAAALLAWIAAAFRDRPGDVGRLNRRTALLFRFIYETGCRPDEAARLTWADVDLDAGIARLARHKTAHATLRPRKIPLAAGLRDALAAARAEPGNHPEYVFTHKRGKGGVARGATREAGEPWRAKALPHRWRELRDRAIAAGVAVPADLTLYDFRRSWQADAIEAGYTAEQTGQAAGTSARMVERVYASARERKLRAMADDLADRRATPPAQRDAPAKHGA